MGTGPDVPVESFLTVAPAGSGEWTAELADLGWGTAFGGDLLARASLAAAASCDGVKRLHALHGHFLRPVPAGAKVSLRVATLGDGERFSRRRVELRHEGTLVCDVVASLTAQTDGIAFQPVRLDPSLPRPESLPSDVELARAEGWPESNLSGIEWRRVRPSFPFPKPAPDEPVSWIGWFRPRTPLPDDAALHEAAFVFTSDLMSHAGVETRLVDFHPGRLTSLDHALWIHCPPRWNDFWLIETTSDVAHSGRALTRREVYARDGARIATVVQEALLG